MKHDDQLLRELRTILADFVSRIEKLGPETPQLPHFVGPSMRSPSRR